MTTSLESAIARFHSTRGTVVGVGFLVTDRRVLTCAHVVAAALRLRHGTPGVPQADLQLDFPLLAPGQVSTARVVQWRPGADVAGLELAAQPPPRAAPVRLVTAGDLWGHSFRAFGFPSGYEQGVWASGVLRGRQADGWLQIEDVKQTGYLVAPGFSGGPVWDDVLDGVVGMIVAADTRERIKAAFLIPADVLAAAWPDVVHVYGEPAVSPQVTAAPPPARQPGGVTIGDVIGGIRGSIIAGGNITGAAITSEGEPVQPARGPVPAGGATPQGATSDRAHLTRLHRILTERFDESELRTLCFNLGVDYDDLPDQGKANKARELIRYLDRRQCIQALLEVGRQQRPDIPWNDISETEMQTSTEPALENETEADPEQRRFNEMLRQVTEFNHCLSRSMPEVTTGYAQAKNRDEMNRILACIAEICETCNLRWTTGDSHGVASPMRRLSKGIWLIEVWECEVVDLWVYRDTTLERQYVLVHLAARPPFGVHDYTPGKLEYEEAGYFDGTYVARAEFDNGYAMIDGEVRELTGAELRMRNLRDDFFILAPQLSVYVFTTLDIRRRARAVHQSLVESGQISCAALRPLEHLERPWY
jgi:S1-C subfamily serine protease